MTKTVHRLYIIFFLIAGIASLFLLNAYGYDYYRLPIEERPFHRLDHTLTPSGYLGHGFGILGTVLMSLGVVVYMMRKRMRTFIRLGFLSHWLELHIFLCTIGPLFILYHTSFKFGGIVSISFWSMAAVVLSGVAGRFIYVQIPHSIEGKELSASEIEEMDVQLSGQLKSGANLSPVLMAKIEGFLSTEKYSAHSYLESLKFVIKDYLYLGKRMKLVQKEIESAGVPKEVIHKTIMPALKQKMVLTRKIGSLKFMHGMFRYWHIFHLPFAIVMFIIMIIHVGVTIVFGYRWIF